MAHRVHMFSRKLNAINDVKHDKQKCNRIIDEEGMELVHCICDCVHNILQGNIPVDDKEKKTETAQTLYEKVGKREDFRSREETYYTGWWISRISNIKTLVGLVGKLFTGQ